MRISRPGVRISIQEKNVFETMYLSEIDWNRFTGKEIIYKLRKIYCRTSNVLFKQDQEYPITLLFFVFFFFTWTLVHLTFYNFLL